MLYPTLWISACASLALAATYVLTDKVIGNDFNSFFQYYNETDPTNGRVNYVDAATAASQNLTFASSDTFILRADYQTVLNAYGPGRNSVRLVSNAQFTNGVTIANIRHMPQGCGTWPAFWSIAHEYSQGEIDILEGVNDRAPNHATLHTDSGCTMPNSRNETGFVSGTNCDVNVGNGGMVEDGMSWKEQAHSSRSGSGLTTRQLFPMV